MREGRPRPGNVNTSKSVTFNAGSTRQTRAASKPSDAQLTGYASRDAALLKLAAEKQREAAQRPPPDVPKAASILVSVAILVLALTTTVSTRWTKGTATFPVVNSSAAAPAAAMAAFAGVASPTVSRIVVRNASRITGIWGNYGEYTGEVGIWSSCLCSQFDAEGVMSSCGSRRARFRAVQAMSVLMLLCELGGLAAFVALSFLTLSKRVEYVAVVAYAAAAVFATLSWIVAVVLFRDDTCGGFSFSAAGMLLHWAFAFRIIESICLTGLSGLLYFRASGKVTMWHVAFTTAVFTLLFSTATTASHLWIGAKGIDATTPSATLSGYPWGTCSCVGILTACGSVASQFRALQAFSVIQTIAHFVQSILVAFVPALLVHVPELAVVGFVWATWCIQLILWSIAAATFSDCRCTPLAQQRFGWPFAVLFVSFLLQTGLACFLSFQLGRKRVLAWIHQQTLAHKVPGNPIEGSLASASKADLERRPESPITFAEPQEAELQKYDPYFDASGPPMRSPSPMQTGMAPVVTVPLRQQAASRQPQPQPPARAPQVPEPVAFPPLPTMRQLVSVSPTREPYR